MLMWFGALNEVVTHWVLANTSERLEDAYPSLRAFLLHSVGAEAADTLPPPISARRDAYVPDRRRDGRNQDG